jgi:1,4-alpha-glucan branching enzyme
VRTALNHAAVAGRQLHCGYSARERTVTVALRLRPAAFLACVPRSRVRKSDASCVLACRSRVRARVQLANGSWADRIPAWIKWATQEWNEIQFNGVYYDPPKAAAPGVYDKEKAYTFKWPRPQRPRSLRVYECHVGMSSEEEKVNSYLEFKEEMVPRIRRLGYNTIQIMAIQVRHHPL